MYKKILLTSTLFLSLISIYDDAQAQQCAGLNEDCSERPCCTSAMDCSKDLTGSWYCISITAK